MKVKLPYKTEEAIEQEVLKFLSQFDNISVPINVEFLAEKVGLRIVPIYTNNSSFKGFLMPKTKEIGIRLSFFEEAKDNVYRFTIAHELAHFVMHMPIYDNFHGTTLDEWSSFYSEHSDTIDRAERQADIFAGFLLLPSKFLIEDLEGLNKAFSKYTKDIREDKIVQTIARKYVVSLRTAQIRLRDMKKC